MTTRFADTRLMPRLPARVEIKKRRTLYTQEAYMVCASGRGVRKCECKNRHYVQAAYGSELVGTIVMQ